MLAGALGASCFNPVHSDAVAALGGEVNGQRPGPTHRPGQPCLVCHGGDGPGPDFLIAGTVFATRGSAQGQGGATVVLTDVNKTSKSIVTNSAGNFYITSKQWSPAYPLSAVVQLNGTTKAMNTLINGSGGCATCHYGADNEATHEPAVYASDK
jgi:hypothetical protein